MTIAALTYAPERRAPKRTIRAALCGLCGLVASGVSTPVAAQGIPLIRDTEIENLLKDYASPIFRAAGLGTGRITVRIVQDENFNAFVLDGRNVFINTGTIMQADTPNEVIGVIAHETGHITGGHMAALRARIKQDQSRVLLAQILGIGLMVAGGISGGGSASELGSAGQGIMYGGNQLFMRSLLAERRQQESAADQAGLSFLNATKQSGAGMLTTFERFRQQEYISDAQKTAFARSHPLSSERLARLRQLAVSSPFYKQKDSSQLQLRHELVRAKLAGYMERPQIVYNRYPQSDQSLPARYARSIARYFQGGQGGLDGAVNGLNGLIRDRPDNPYFWETKGDLLMRSGKSREAIGPLRQALKLLPDASLIQVQLATALLLQDDKASLNEAISLLRKSIAIDDNSTAYRQMANAYYKLGRQPQAEAMMAQAYFINGDIKQAQTFAKRAQTKLKPGTPEWVKNDDIINYKPQT